MSKKSPFLTAREAAAELGVLPMTLYAYVSRGLVRSEGSAGSRTRRYRREDIVALRNRKEYRRDPEKAAESALHFGTPVMESELSLLTEDGLYYRGHETISLAETRTLEEVAELLWTGALEGPLRKDPAPALGSVLRLPRKMVTIDRFQILLPLAATEDPRCFDRSPEGVARAGMRILRILAAVTVGANPKKTPIADVLARGWRLKGKDAANHLNAAMILCADHELNVSAFTVRCVASAGSTPYAAVMAGLAALQGSKHGGLTARVSSFLREVGSARHARKAVEKRLRRGESIPGFGHPLYPGGDPRGRALLRRVRPSFRASKLLELTDAVEREVRRTVGLLPTVDFGLVTLAQALELPDDGPMVLFAIGRTSGWIGHAIEQYRTNRMIRPRARYVGVVPSEGGVSPRAEEA